MAAIRVINRFEGPSGMPARGRDLCRRKGAHRTIFSMESMIYGLSMQGTRRRVSRHFYDECGDHIALEKKIVKRSNVQFKTTHYPIQINSYADSLATSYNLHYPVCRMRSLLSI
jgi:hypothetical protein